MTGRRERAPDPPLAPGAPSDAVPSAARSTSLYDRGLYFALRGIVWPLFWIAFHGRVVLDEPLPRRGPAIFAANHRSLMDGVLIHSVIRRPLRVFIAKEWAEWWAIHWLTSSMGAIEVRRDKRNHGAFVAALEALRRGDAVALFPEGGIQHDDRLARFRHGAARLALATGAPVYPVAIIGSSDAMPWPRRIPRLRRITVRCGKALRFVRESQATVADGPFPEVEDGEPAHLGTATQAIHNAVAALIERGHA